MPELPEVETVRRGLAPLLEGARILSVRQHRADLRFPFPANLAERLEGKVIGTLDRRGKYMLWPLSSGETLIAHLGMTGRFLVGASRPGTFHREVAPLGHVHLSLDVQTGGGVTAISYADPRRFGFMDLVATREIDGCAHFSRMGPEPLSEDFTAAALMAALRGRSAPIKSALLDQRTVAGLGNIYVCEALFRSRISPRRQARNIGAGRVSALHGHVVDVLREAITAGGSTLRDFAHADGNQGYFQHRFDVYDREGEPCPACGTPIRRIVQSGRSTFYCGRCQR